MFTHLKNNEFIVEICDSLIHRATVKGVDRGLLKPGFAQVSVKQRKKKHLRGMNGQ